MNKGSLLAAVAVVMMVMCACVVMVSSEETSAAPVTPEEAPFVVDGAYSSNITYSDGVYTVTDDVIIDLSEDGTNLGTAEAPLDIRFTIAQGKTLTFTNSGDEQLTLYINYTSPAYAGSNNDSYEPNSVFFTTGATSSTDASEYAEVVVGEGVVLDLEISLDADVDASSSTDNRNMHILSFVDLTLRSASGDGEAGKVVMTQYGPGGTSYYSGTLTAETGSVISLDNSNGFLRVVLDMNGAEMTIENITGAAAINLADGSSIVNSKITNTCDGDRYGYLYVDSDVDVTIEGSVIDMGVAVIQIRSSDVDITNSTITTSGSVIVDDIDNLPILPDGTVVEIGSHKYTIFNREMPVRGVSYYFVLGVELGSPTYTGESFSLRDLSPTAEVFSVYTDEEMTQSATDISMSAGLDPSQTEANEDLDTMINVGEYSLSVTVLVTANNTAGTTATQYFVISANFEIVAAPATQIEIEPVEGSQYPEFTYTGEPILPKAGVDFDVYVNGELADLSAYEVTYSDANPTDSGSYTLTVTLIPGAKWTVEEDGEEVTKTMNYSGTETDEYRIVADLGSVTVSSSQSGILQGQVLDGTALTIAATGVDGNPYTGTLGVDDFVITGEGFDSDHLVFTGSGSVTVTFAYSGDAEIYSEVTFDVSAATSITVSGDYDKSYDVGETLNKEDMTLTVTYDDTMSSSAEFTYDAETGLFKTTASGFSDEYVYGFEFDPETFDEAGEEVTVTVTLFDAEGTFTVEVTIVPAVAYYVYIDPETGDYVEYATQELNPKTSADVYGMASYVVPEGYVFTGLWYLWSGDLQHDAENARYTGLWYYYGENYEFDGDENIWGGRVVTFVTYLNPEIGWDALLADAVNHLGLTGSGAPWEYFGEYGILGNIIWMTYGPEYAEVDENIVSKLTDIRDDFSRTMGGIYRAAEALGMHIDSLEWNGATYSWNASGGNSGSNWNNDATGSSLVSDLQSYFFANVDALYEDLFAGFDITLTLRTGAVYTFEYCIEVEEPVIEVPEPEYVTVVINGTYYGVEVGTEIQLSAPAQVGDYVLFGWTVNGTPIEADEDGCYIYVVSEDDIDSHGYIALEPVYESGDEGSGSDVPVYDDRTVRQLGNYLVGYEVVDGELYIYVLSDVSNEDYRNILDLTKMTGLTDGGAVLERLVLDDNGDAMFGEYYVLGAYVMDIPSYLFYTVSIWYADEWVDIGTGYLYGFYPTDITVDPDSITIAVGQSYGDVEVTVEAGESADTTLTWTTSDEGVAVVDGDGVITGVSAGTATITVTTVNGLSAEIEVSVGSFVSITIGFDDAGRVWTVGDTVTSEDIYVIAHYSNGLEIALEDVTFDPEVLSEEGPVTITVSANGPGFNGATAYVDIYVTASA